MAKVENTAAGFENVTTSKPEIDSEAAAISIAKPGAFDLNKFKSKRAAAMANVETLLTALPHHSISQAKDFVRLHPDEATYWSPELCFANVPVKGQKRDTVHLIDEDLAMRFLRPRASFGSDWHWHPNRMTFSFCATFQRETRITPGSQAT